MTLDLEKYTFREGVTPLSGEELNPRFYAIVRRLHDLEQQKMDWEQAVAEVQNHGLQRINDAVAPLLDGLRADMVAVIALGEAAQENQAAAVNAMLAAMEDKITEVDTLLAGLAGNLVDVVEVSGLLTKEAVTEEGVAKLRLSVPLASPTQAVAGTAEDLAVTPHGLAVAMVSMTRDMIAGIIVEWEAATIPTLADAKPLGLELDGAVVSTTVYPRLLRKWCGSSANATAPAWYKCDSTGTRNGSGAYIKLQDRRGEFTRGFDHGRGIDASRVLASAQSSILAPHAHTYMRPQPTYPSLGNPDGAGYTSIQSLNGAWDYVATDANSPSGDTRPRNIATMYIVLV